MAFSFIQSLSTKLLQAICGTTSTSHQQDPPFTDREKSVREDLKKLSQMLTWIQTVQQGAEEKENDESTVRRWLVELRGVAYRAEDVLDEFYYEVLRSIVESGDAAIEDYHRDGGTRRQFAEMYTSSSLGSHLCDITKASIPDGMAEDIKSITERFEEISNARKNLYLREEDGTRMVMGPQIRPPTSSHVDERAIFGREEEKEKIISLMNLSSGPNFMVLPIVGMGGFGKTTLAQLVYNDSRICGLFEKRCWVSVSQEFDPVRLTKDIIVSMSGSPCQSSELRILQDGLKEKIRDLRLFLVLDDVWNDKRNLWECFQVVFFGAKFVRILTTTRDTSLAKIMQTTSPFPLGSLPEENCWSLFKHFALGNKEPSDNANLYKIGYGIVKKCKGSPLAIKALGGILRYEMDEEKWGEILESDILKIDGIEHIRSALWLSYKKLPKHLKPCFLYLSMFPKNTPLEKDMVVRLWMAQGYINGDTRNLKTLEEIGSEYFDELQGRSLVDCVPSTKYLLHDLVHDLARSISEECSGLFKVYHLYLTSNNNNQAFSPKRDKLLDSVLPLGDDCSIRTFVKECPRSWNFDFAISSEIVGARALHLRYSLLPNKLDKLKHLRYLSFGNSQMETLPETLCLLYNLQTLDLNSFYLRELPENIKYLINLRYFSLSSGKIQQLPESIFMLRNLHTLSLQYCTKLKELPRGIEKLTRLRILDLPLSLISMPSGIGKLTTLKPLSGHFSVMDHGMLGGLGELKDMNELSGLLCISGLRNINDVEYSRNANLASKPNLHKLSLNFREVHSILGCKEKELHLAVCSRKNANENDEKILTSLEPHGNLTELEILNYGGRFFPSWLHNPLFPKLITLTLNFSIEPNSLPPFGQLPYLKFLDISGNTNVRNEGDELNKYSLLTEYGSSKQFKSKEPCYPSLEVLLMRNMLNLVEWQAHDGDFPCLKELVIENCPKLWKIATIPQEVWEVTFEYCPKLEHLTCPSIIRNLKINECGFREIIFRSVSENLTISKCVELNLINWMEGGLHSVTKVTFEYCPKLEIVAIPIGTRKLIINECGFREIMFQPVSSHLTISSCKELNSINWMDKGLNSVRKVTFENCPKLELLTIPVGTSKLKISKCGFHKIMFQSVSEYLTISSCKELNSINWMDGGLNYVREVSFRNCPNLELIANPIGTKKLIINDCGFREIMFLAVSEYLRISNCIELISINWMDGGLNSVRAVSFEYCPKLEIIAIPVGTLKLKIHECGIHKIMLRSVSKYLRISNCIELISINWMDRGLNSVRAVSFEKCPKLELVTIPVGTLALIINECGFREIILQSVSGHLTISNCIELISINWMDGGLNYVREVSFQSCPKLELQFPVKDVLHSMTQRAEILDCPRIDLGKRYIYQRDTTIEGLNLYGNKEIHLGSVNSAIPLLENPFTLFLTKEDIREAESLTPSAVVSCQHIMLNLPLLVLLEISRCTKVISVAGLDNLRNLKRLSISYCPELCNWKDETLPLSLKYLELDSCDKLSSLPQLSVQNHPSILKALEINKCPSLAVLEGFHGLMKLKTVKLLHCRNITISPATGRLHFRLLITTIVGCPLMRDWCRENTITYYELNPTDNPPR